VPRTIGVPVRGRGVPFRTTPRAPATAGAIITGGADTTALGATAVAWKAGGIAPRPCARKPAGRSKTKPAKMIWRTMVPT